MNKLISWLPSIGIRQMLAVLLVGLIFFVGTAFDIHGNSLQARAAQGQIASLDRANVKAERVKENAEKSAKLLEEEGMQVKNRAAQSTQESGGNLIDTVREKLNLDEPIDPGTKQTAEQLKDTVTGDRD